MINRYKKISSLIYFSVLVTFLTGCTKDKTQVPPVFKDVDGNIIELVTIGTQTWTSKNLTVSRYRNGDAILDANFTTWQKMVTGAWCNYLDKRNAGTMFGKLYNWSAVNDPRGLAPEGFHIPTKAEWMILINYLGSDSLAGNKLKANTDPRCWYGINTLFTNSLGFTALPGGYCSPWGDSFGLNWEASWWTSTGEDTANVWSIELDYEGHIRFINTLAGFGFSVRCLKD